MPSLSLKAESWGNTFRVSTCICAPVGFTLEWLVYSKITGPPGYYYYYHSL